jgi:hypothetical protein
MFRLNLLRIGFALFLTVLCSTTLRAQMDGNKLLSECTVTIRQMDTGVSPDSANQIDDVHCLGFIEGVLEGLVVGESAGDENHTATKKRYVCIPDGASLGQNVRVVVKWMKEHPKDLHRRAALLIYVALLEAYPCPSS